MIKNLEIRNFKSIKRLQLDCKRTNVFIGEPNTGKSNILETLGTISYGRYGAHGHLRDFVRFERTSNLFYDEILEENVEIKFDARSLNIQLANGSFTGICRDEKGSLVNFAGDHNDLRAAVQSRIDELSPFKFYRFAGASNLDRPEAEFLLPPSGSNLMSLLLKHRDLRNTANQVFSRFGLRLGLRPQERKIEIIKQLEDIIVSYPYSLTSDTLQRLIFYLSAVLSNSESVLVFEEPESHAFPYYTKYLAETIALDEKRNQYFVSTHNPYFLLPLLEKSPREDVAIFITYYEDYETKTKLLSEEQMQEITEIDVFSNIERFL